MVIAAVEAICDPAFALVGVSGTTDAVALLVIVNGPVRTALDVNCGAGVFGPGWRANATIGRAVRLVWANVGGAVPGEISMSTFAQPGRYTLLHRRARGRQPVGAAARRARVRRGRQHRRAAGRRGAAGRGRRAQPHGRRAADHGRAQRRGHREHDASAGSATRCWSSRRSTPRRSRRTAGPRPTCATSCGSGCASSVDGVADAEAPRRPTISRSSWPAAPPGGSRRGSRAGRFAIRRRAWSSRGSACHEPSLRLSLAHEVHQALGP